MKIQGTVRTVMAGVALLTVAACTQDLDVPNTNNPDISRVLATPQDVQNLAVSSVNDWYQGATDVDPWVMLNVTADVATMNYGNFGARLNNLQPRIPYNNNVASGDAEAAEDPWNNQYTVIGETDDVLQVLASGVDLPGGTDKYKALALWAQAGALQEITLVYDSAFAVDETTIPDAFIGYPEMETFTLGKLDALIAFAGAQSFQYDQTEFPLEGDLNSAKLTRFANTMAAQLMTYNPRNAAEAGQVDWAKVLTYADKGIGAGSGGTPFDFDVIGDDTKWGSSLTDYFDYMGWMMVDLKLIHQMVPNVPSEYTGVPDGCDVACYDGIYAPGATHDNRVGVDVTVGSANVNAPGTDFIYARQVQGDPRRGIYMQSPYYHSRYFTYSYQSQGESNLGPQPWTLAAGNDLIKAEALVRSGGDKNEAATLVNNTRVTRGGLPPLTAASTQDEFIAAITYERLVELYATNGYGHFAQRHVDSLRIGSVRHLPVPAQELGSDGLPVYTYGGEVENPTGMNMVPGTASHQLVLDLSHLRQGPFRTINLPNGQQMQIMIPKPNRRLARPPIKQ